MRIKYTIAAKRPIEFSPQVQPMIATPTHGSLPSGHATEAFIAARMLWKLLRASGTPQYQQDGVWGEMFMRLASRIAINRTVAGVHFPMDSVAGAFLGLTLADFIHEHCDPATQDSTSGKFDGTRFDAADDFDWHQLYGAQDDLQPKKSGPSGNPWATTTQKQSKNEVHSAPLAWLWGKAVAEWQDLPCA